MNNKHRKSQYTSDDVNFDTYSVEIQYDKEVKIIIM